MALPSPLARHALISLSLLAATAVAQAEGISPLVIPSLHLLNDTVPTDGVLLLAGGAGWGGWQVSVSDAAGRAVPGVLETRGELLLFRPSQPLIAGQRYSVSSSVGVGINTTSFSVVASSAVTFDTDVEFVFSETSRALERACCTEDLERTRDSSCSTVRTTTVQVVVAQSKSAPDPVNAGQLLAAIELDGAPGELASWALAADGTVAPQGVRAEFDRGTEHCARLRLLDLRTLVETTGTARCEGSTFEPSIVTRDVSQALSLDWTTCQVPPAAQLQLWCDHNASQCQTSSCNFYGHLCRGEPVPAPPPNPWLGGGQVPAAASDAGESASDGGAAHANLEPTPPDGGEAGGGCSLSAHQEQNGSRLLCWLAVLGISSFGLRRKRA